jgi:hypothetical protein
MPFYRLQGLTNGVVVEKDFQKLEYDIKVVKANSTENEKIMRQVVAFGSIPGNTFMVRSK